MANPMRDALTKNIIPHKNKIVSLVSSSMIADSIEAAQTRGRSFVQALDYALKRGEAEGFINAPNKTICGKNKGEML